MKIPLKLTYEEKKKHHKSQNIMVMHNLSILARACEIRIETWIKLSSDKMLVFFNLQILILLDIHKGKKRKTNSKQFEKQFTL